MICKNAAFLAHVHAVLTASGFVASGCLQIQIIMVILDTTEVAVILLHTIKCFWRWWQAPCEACKWVL